MSELEKGWALEAWAGVYHFEHVTEAEAEARMERREHVFVVETINWTVAEDDGVHLNKYFVFGLSAAIGMAAKLLGDLQEVAEDIVGIRPATPDEERMFLAVVDHFNEQLPPALSDDEAGRLARGMGL
jgi:hypothetical protein